MGNAGTRSLDRRLTRRALVAGAGASVAGLGIASGMQPDGTPSAGTPESGTPIATPRATPKPTATPEPTPTPPPTGVLEVVREQRPEYDATPVRGGEVRLMRSGTAETALEFSPTAVRQDPQVALSYLDPLLRPDPVTMEPKTWLATGWEWSDADTVITYTLRDDVVWHDGSRLTAGDVVFSLFAYRDDYQSSVANLFALMDDAVALDDTTVQVTLREPDGGWLFNASTQFIFQQAQYEEHWGAAPAGQRTLAGFDWAASAPIGTGPWRVGDRSDGAILLERNDDYWADPPHLDRQIITWEAADDRRREAWLQGEIDLLWPLAPADLDAVKETPGRLYVADAASVMFLAFNFDNPLRATPDLFGDARMRRALSLSIDRDRYAEAVFRGFIDEDATGTIAQPWAHLTNRTNPPRELEQARTLFRELGWEDRDGDGVLDSLTGSRFGLTAIVADDDRPELLATLNRVAEDFAEVGMLLTVEALPRDAFQQRWTVSRDYDFIAYAYDLYPGFTDFDLYGSAWDIRGNRQGWNPGGYANAEADLAIAEALVAVDIDAQREALARLQKIVDDDLFALWLGFPQDLILTKLDLLGFRPNKAWQTADLRHLWWSD